MNNTELKARLSKNERSQAWLSRKLNVSPAAVCYWCSGIDAIPQKRIEKIKVWLI